MEEDISVPLLCALVTVLVVILRRQRSRVARREGDGGSISDESDDDGEPRSKRTRLVYDRPEYDQSGWARMLKRTDILGDPDSREAKLFRRTFRVPYPFFLGLVEEVREGNWEGFTTDKTDCGGRGSRPCIPLELKILMVLQVLGRGNCFDDMRHTASMSEQTAQRVFHAFTERFAKEFYPRHVKFPEGEARADILNDYAEVGFPGALGSMDVTHVHWVAAPHSLRHSYVGKEGYPTLAYQCTVSHDMVCLGVSEGFAGAQNDKTIVRFDAFVNKVRQDCKDVEYTLKDAKGEEYQERGLYLIVDGGYHLWRCLQCPLKNPATQDELAFRERHESVRKDVECFFGVLKGRFRILKLPVQFRGKSRMNNMFFTCCILHNMLHAYDGIELLEADVDWSGRDGDLDPWVPGMDDEEGALLFSTDSSVSTETIEVESEFATLQKKLLTNFTVGMTEGSIGWKRS